jgi:hypothetical protein
MGGSAARLNCWLRGGEVLLSSDDKVTVGEVSWLQPLRLELALGGFNRGLPCEDVDGHAHACADLGLM